jgi:hypothetical protein
MSDASCVSFTGTLGCIPSGEPDGGVGAVVPLGGCGIAATVAGAPPGVMFDAALPASDKELRLKIEVDQ